MTDVHSKETRSFNMSRIRGKNTKPEMLVRKYLFSRGLRFRIHVQLPGRPDVVLPRYRIALFVHGCFWHGHEGCKYFVVPKTRQDWWLQKINGNCANDVKNMQALGEQGWQVIVVWECALRKGRVEETLPALFSEIQGMYKK
jgi:DNA mismatch endonuclease (patch repair protein)